MPDRPVTLAPKVDAAGQYIATLSAAYRTKSLSAPITVDPGLASVQIPPASEPDAVFFNVQFSGPAPAVVIPKGRDSANFAVTTVPVTSPSDVNIIGSLGSTTVTSPR